MDNENLPPLYGNWNSLYHKERQWSKAGLFEKLLRFINADAYDSTLLETDSTFYNSALKCTNNVTVSSDFFSELKFSY